MGNKIREIIRDKLFLFKVFLFELNNPKLAHA